MTEKDQKLKIKDQKEEEKAPEKLPVNTIIGKKIGMTQIFNEDGSVVPVTVIEAGPCPIIQIKTKEKDGYSAIQLGFVDKGEKNLTKPIAGHFKKSKVSPKRYLREVRVNSDDKFKQAQEVKVDIFDEGELVDVSGITIGKGFQGGMKRHGWSGGPASHGSMLHRAPGSIGASADPSKVVKGHPLPGHMGTNKVTTQHLKVVRIDADKNLILVKGSVPGKRDTLLMVRKSIKKSK